MHVDDRKHSQVGPKTVTPKEIRRRCAATITSGLFFCGRVRFMRSYLSAEARDLPPFVGSRASGLSSMGRHHHEHAVNFI